MKDARDEQSRPPGASRRLERASVSGGRQRALSLVVLIAGVACLCSTILARATWPSSAAAHLMAQERNRDYSVFSHGSASHASLACANCHRRPGDNSARPDWPGHKDCTGCHLGQFTTPGSPICAICHTDVGGRDAPLKSFPENFKESFNVKFDHVQHMQAGTRPPEGCAFCHDRPVRRGLALSIPAGMMNAHGKCYTCHTPASRDLAGREMASCATCHDPVRYAPASTDARAFRASFSHAKHGARQRLACADCHNLVAGQPQSKVTSPVTAEHFIAPRAQSCQTCHNGKRAFGGDLDFKSCRRCHTGPTFRLGV